jgi:hypothetical protein
MHDDIQKYFDYKGMYFVDLICHSSSQSTFEMFKLSCLMLHFTTQKRNFKQSLLNFWKRMEIYWKLHLEYQINEKLQVRMCACCIIKRTWKKNGFIKVRYNLKCSFLVSNTSWEDCCLFKGVDNQFSRFSGVFKFGVFEPWDCFCFESQELRVIIFFCMFSVHYLSDCWRYCTLLRERLLCDWGEFLEYSPEKEC